MYYIHRILNYILYIRFVHLPHTSARAVFIPHLICYSPHTTKLRQRVAHLRRH